MLQWIPAFNGGYRQWFCVDYRLLNVTSWNRISVQKTEDDYNRNEPQPVVFRLEGLAPSSTYEIRLLAMNVKGNSQPTYTIVNRTMDQRKYKSGPWFTTTDSLQQSLPLKLCSDRKNNETVS